MWNFTQPCTHSEANKTPTYLILPHPSSSSLDWESLESSLTTEDILRAIASFPINKAPGPDGFPAGFYKVFGSTLAPLLTYLLEELDTKGLDPDQFSDSTIVVLEEEGKDASECGRYRPISFITTDTKILTKFWLLGSPV